MSGDALEMRFRAGCLMSFHFRLIRSMILQNIIKNKVFVLSEFLKWVVLAIGPICLTPVAITESWSLTISLIFFYLNLNMKILWCFYHVRTKRKHGLLNMANLGWMKMFDPF